MLRPRSAAVVVPLLAVLLGGCASDPGDQLRDSVADVIDEANAGDAGGLRGALSNLRSEIDGQVRDGDLPSAEATRLLAIVQQLEADAALLEEEEDEPSPTPSPTPEESEEPSPTPSPTPEETEEEDEEEPEPTEPAEPTEEPEPEPEPTDILPSPVQTTSEPSPSASPAQAVRPAEPSPSPSGA